MGLLLIECVLLQVEIEALNVAMPEKCTLSWEVEQFVVTLVDVSESSKCLNCLRRKNVRCLFSRECVFLKRALDVPLAEASTSGITPTFVCK